ncbi:MAG: 2Fe-2S iron-sulfur cluster-binding protein [Pirellulales bacterium]
MTDRLPPQPGEWIRRAEPIRFQFEGRTYQGYRGDVLSSALWANGVHILGRSFKYHRPRSLYSLAGFDANVIVEDGTNTNLRGDQLLITEGMSVRAVNTKGGVERDRYRIMEWFSSFLPVGFYYKAFHTPRRLFPFYERIMRRAAGLGAINASARTPASPKDYDFCELAVIGAGPAGLSAAIAAAETGADVLVIDEQPHPGGSLTWQHAEADARLKPLLERVRALPNIRLRSGTQAAGWYADQWIGLVDSCRLTKLRTRATLVAAGSIEQPAVFHNNDVPGVMLGSAAQRLIRLFAVRPCNRAIVLAANDDAYRVALDLVSAGVSVAAVVDLRSPGSPSAVMQKVAAAGIEILHNHTIYEAEATADRSNVKAAVVCPLDSEGRPRVAQTRRIPCDGIVASVGWAPNMSLLAQTGSRLQYEPRVEQFVPRDLAEGVFAAGRVNGIYDLESQLADGARAGLAASAYLGHAATAPEPIGLSDASPSHPYPIFSHPHKKNFVDFDEDLQLVDFVNAHQEGFDSVELMKRYSTVGMGPSQGKISNMNAARIVARLNGKTLENTGTTTARPFYQPVSIAHLAGRRFHPHRLTPMDRWHRAAGAKMIPVGAWFRPEYYAVRGKTAGDCILQEALAVRKHVGLIDLSTLGKLLVYGPDAAVFLERIYTGSFQKQKLGTLRYGVACDETGIVIEDGVIARFAQDRFYVSATTGGSDAFYREMQRWAMVFKMDVVLANATGQFAAMNLAGPDARRVLEKLTDMDLAPETFPFSGAREGEVAEVPAKVMRVGFVGELGYEIHVPMHQALRVWEALLEAGAEFGIRPFGTEAQRLLRLEKGHLIVSHDTDALTNPFEAHLDPFVHMKKPFFVGKRSLDILQRSGPERRLVGIEFAPNGGKLPEECHLIIQGDAIVGRVTSIAERTTVGKPIGLAFVRSHLAAPDSMLRVRVGASQYVEARVTTLPFYDPTNSRQN